MARNNNFEFDFPDLLDLGAMLPVIDWSGLPELKIEGEETLSGMTSSESRREKHAAAQRRYRQLQRDGAAVLRVALPFNDVVAALITSGRLSEEDALDRGKVEIAIAVVVIDWSKGW